MSAIMTQLMLPDIKSDKRGYGAAVDIGTTTVVVYLYDMGAQECLAVVSRMNDQTQYGLDVISRIQYCNEHGDGVQILQRTIVSQLNDMIGAASEKAGIARERISHSVITGNTTMLHLLSGLSPHSLGELPFRPLSRFGESVPLSRLGIIAGEQAMCYLPPCKMCIRDRISNKNQLFYEKILYKVREPFWMPVRLKCERILTIL